MWGTLFGATSKPTVPATTSVRKITEDVKDEIEEGYFLYRNLVSIFPYISKRERSFLSNIYKFTITYF